ncbi:uncharacterized protein TNIN_408431, partial [Trichonephila inaurata madagascariensis]
AWHKRYFVLRDETQDRSPCLEMYEKDELFTAPLGIAGPKLILDLGRGSPKRVYIGLALFPFALVMSGAITPHPRRGGRTQCTIVVTRPRTYHAQGEYR